MTRLLIVLLGVALSSLGCLGNPWKEALGVDSPAGYHQFIRKHPRSPYIEDARERIAFHKVKRRPTLAGYEDFQAEYPNSQLIAELRPIVEGLAFDAARARGTASAYAEFAQAFPGGAYATRAAGNAAYLAADGFRGHPEQLGPFAAEHPQSDFAAEARRTVAAFATRRGTRFRRVGLVVEVSPSTPESDRIRKEFTSRAQEIYRDAGLELVVIPEIVTARSGGLPPVRLEIKHREELETTVVSGNDVSRAGYVARTQVTLRSDSDGPPIWSREFALRVLPHERIAGASLLFASKPAKHYWADFFLPVATWQTNAAVRPVMDLGHEVSAVDAALGRAVVLFEDGDFKLLGLADPSAPVVLAEYDRPSKLDHFEGVRIVGEQVVLFGQDGLEIVGFGREGPVLKATRPRGEVGSIRALEPVDEGLLLASSRGLLLADKDGANAQRVMRRMILGLASMGDTLVFADGESVFVATLELLRENRVLSQLRLGKTFKPERVRIVESTVVVMGEGGALVLDLSDRRKPRVTSKFTRRASGRISDAIRVDGRVFLLGFRGVQVLDGHARRVLEAIDVAPRERVATTGRHLVLVGDKKLQVVDAMPFALHEARPARPESAH